MVSQPIVIFPHFKPAEAEIITGFSSDAKRDLKRRGLLEGIERQKLGVQSIAYLLLMKLLTEHGFGPKTVQGLVSRYSPALLDFVLHQPDVWENDHYRKCWAASRNKEPSRYLLIGANVEAHLANEPYDAADAQAVMTIIDFAKAGARLTEALVHKPFKLMAVSGTCGR